MPSKTQRIAGWILTALIGLFLIVGSGIPKFFDWPGKEEMMEKIGFPLSLLPKIAVIEILVTLVYLIPRTSFLGAILITGYLGGAVVTHLRMGEPWYFPVLLGVLVWVGLALRQPLVFKLAFGGSVAPRQVTETFRGTS